MKMKISSNFLLMLLGLCIASKQVLARPEKTYADQDTDYTADDAADEDVEDYPEGPHKILSLEQHVTPKLGATVKLPCHIEGGGQDVVVQWSRGPKQEVSLYLGTIKQSEDHRYKLDTKDYTLTIENIQPEDNDEFTCALVGEDVAVTHTVTVKSGPSIRIRPDKDFVEKEGRPITFECEATGTPEPHVHWIKHNHDDEHPPAHSNKLSINKLTWRHTGNYTCVAKNAQGETSETVTMKVLAKPEVKAEARNVNSAEKYESEIVCNVIYCSKSNCQVDWKKENKTIKPDNKHYHIYQEGTKHMLRISATKNNDFGQYSCVVRNEVGTTQEDINLTGKPLKPVLMSQHNSLKGPVLSWKILSKAEIVDYEVIYKKQEEDQWIIKHPDIADGQNGIYTLNYTFEIPQDQIGTYTAKLRAKNQEYGYSELSDEAIFASGGSYDEPQSDSNRLEPSTDPGNGSSASHMELRVSLALILSLLTAYHLH